MIQVFACVVVIATLFLAPAVNANLASQKIITKMLCNQHQLTCWMLTICFSAIPFNLDIQNQLHKVHIRMAFETRISMISMTMTMMMMTMAIKFSGLWIGLHPMHP
jgi:hypothetical protein